MNKSHTIIIIIYIYRKVLIKFAKQYKHFIWNLTLIYLKNERKIQEQKETKESIPNDSKHPKHQYF